MLFFVFFFCFFWLTRHGKTLLDLSCRRENKDFNHERSLGMSTIVDAWGWCTGTTQRDGMVREEGGGFRMGNTCIPVVDSFRYLAKLIQYCKV